MAIGHLHIPSIPTPMLLKEDEFYQFIFPLFQGIFMLIYSNWILLLDVHIWNKYYINYKEHLKFQNNKFSTEKDIFRRNLFFTCVFIFMICWYQLLLQDKFPLWMKDTLNIIPKSYTPILVFMIYGGYLIFPSKTFFNGEGRLFFWNLCYECVQNIFNKNAKIEFRHVWFSDQFVSLISTLKDLNYFVCYYTVGRVDMQQLLYCLSKRFDMMILTASIPLLVRMLQCAKIGYDIDTKFFRSTQFYNFLKYFCSLMMILFSYLQNQYFISMIYWAIVAVISSLYSFYWDLKYDWDLLQKEHQYLRENRLFPKKFYYFAIIANFFARFGWALTVCDNMVAIFGIRPQIPIFCICFIEINRRGLWNIIRMEKQEVLTLELINKTSQVTYERSKTILLNDT